MKKGKREQETCLLNDNNHNPAMNLDALHYLDKVRAITSRLPGVTEGRCFGTPAFYAGKKFFARLREEGDILVIYNEERDKWMQKDPETFYITSHYENFTYMLVALKSVSQQHLTALINGAWRKRIGKRILAEWEREQK